MMGFSKKITGKQKAKEEIKNLVSNFYTGVWTAKLI